MIALGHHVYRQPRSKLPNGRRCAKMNSGNLKTPTLPGQGGGWRDLDLQGGGGENSAGSIVRKPLADSAFSLGGVALPDA
jgi:hypothetical protein